MNESQAEANITLPEGLDAAYVFQEVRGKLTSEPSRDLWRKVESEVRGAEMDAAYTYLRSRFTGLEVRAREALDRFKERDIIAANKRT